MSELLMPHIEMKQGALGPKARIAAKGIDVSAIMIWHEHLGMSINEIVREYNLTRAEVHAGLAYYYDHKEEVEQQLAHEEAFIAEMKRQYPSKLEEKLKAAKDKAGE